MATVSQVWAFWAPPWRSTSSGSPAPHTRALRERSGPTVTEARRTTGGPSQGGPNSSAFSWNSPSSSYSTWVTGSSVPPVPRDGPQGGGPAAVRRRDRPPPEPNGEEWRHVPPPAVCRRPGRRGGNPDAVDPPQAPPPALWATDGPPRPRRPGRAGRRPGGGRRRPPGGVGGQDPGGARPEDPGRPAGGAGRAARHG